MSRLKTIFFRPNLKNINSNFHLNISTEGRISILQLQFSLSLNQLINKSLQHAYASNFSQGKENKKSLLHVINHLFLFLIHKSFPILINPPYLTKLYLVCILHIWFIRFMSCRVHHNKVKLVLFTHLPSSWLKLPHCWLFFLLLLHPIPIDPNVCYF